MLIYTLTAFGGPQAHLGMILKRFVKQKHYLTEEELLDYYSFCQLLPGPSTTQLIGLVGYKRGGPVLAILTLLVWILPATLLMLLLSLFITRSDGSIQQSLRYIQPMVIGFLSYAALQMFRLSINHLVTQCIMLVTLIVSYFYLKTPWLFPLLLIMGGWVTNLSTRRIPQKEAKEARPVRWRSIWIFVLLFAVAGFLSETSRKNEWKDRRLFNLFENFYRFGSLVFGGGDVLLPIMIDQYVERPKHLNQLNRNPNAIQLNREELLQGFGMVRAIPGPVFSVSSYVGSVTMKSQGLFRQCLGSLVSTMGMFLPGALLMLFFFPVWQHLKHYAVVYRSLEGIHAVAVGFMWAGALYLIKNYFYLSPTETPWMGLGIMISTFVLLHTRIPSPLLVLLTLSIGWWM